MKTIKWLATSTLLLTLLFTACKKDDELTDQQANQQIIVASEDNTTAESLYQGVDDDIDQIVESRGPGANNACPTVTVTPSWDEFPRTVTIDFGTDGCLGADGRTRKGVITVVQTAEWWVPDATRTTAFTDFFVDGAQLEGTVNLINEGYDANGNITLSRTVNGAKITFPNGDVTTWETAQSLVQTEGGSTPLLQIDNEFEFTMTANGVNRNGQAFSVNTTEPLLKKKVCPWVVSGVLQLQVADKTISLDYGAGNCDKFGELTLPNGTVMTIEVRRSW